MKQYKGFTLAEVLITLGIIGIVAAMTIPSLMQNTQDFQLKQAWKKEFSAIVQAYNRVKQDEGGDLSAFYSVGNGTTPIVQGLGNYLTFFQSCGVPYAGDYYNICGSNPTVNVTTNPYKTQDGNAVHFTNLIEGQYILKDGAQLYFRTANAGRLIILVDVNGFKKGPNTAGKDLFGISASTDWIKPLGAPDTGTENSCNTTALCSGSGVYGYAGIYCAGIGCSSEYLYN